MLSSAYWPAEGSAAVLDQTVGDLLRSAAERAPDLPALVEGVPDPAQRRRWTYAELLEQSETAARALCGRFDPGERIAVWANNIPEWLVLEMAAALAGMTLVTVNPALRTAEVRHVLGQSRSAGVFLLREYRGNPMAETVAAVREELPELRDAILFEDWASFCASGSGSRPLPAVSPSAAQIQYTSGTTGLPKGALLHHRGITNNARLCYAETLNMQAGEVAVNPMPLFHTAGCVLITLSSIATLGTHVLMPHFDPSLQLELIAAERSVVFGGVPTMLLATLANPRFAETDMSSVRYALSGGAPVPAELVRRIESTLGVPMHIIYAQTEASPGITMTRADDEPADRAETLGRPLPAIEVKIIAPVDGATVPPDVVGELCTRGYHVMTGYFDEPAQTAAAIDAEGWLHTGDLASMDARGYCRIAGRLKEMIIRGGENIYPREIEDVLFDHPDVAEVAVLGVPDDTWGEQVAAFMRPTQGRLPTEDELVDYCRERLARHKIPHYWVFVEQFPLTGSGKIQKYVLREQHAAARNDPAEDASPT